MGLTQANEVLIAFKKLSGKAHTNQNFAVSEEGITTSVQSSYSTVFAQPITPLPVTNSGFTSLYSSNGIVERIKFQIDIIPNTQIAVGQSQGYKLKLPSDYSTHPGKLYHKFSSGTYLNSALGRLQIVPSLYGQLKPDGSTEYDPILYKQDGSTVISKFDPINWYFDPYSGILFVEDPPAGFDSSANRPGYLEAFLYVGDYLNDVLIATSSGSTGTTGNNVGVGTGIFKDKTSNLLNFKSLVGGSHISVTGTTNNVIITFTGSTGTITGATNGLFLTGGGKQIGLGGTLSANTAIELKNNSLTLSDSASTSNYSFFPTNVSFSTVATGSSYSGTFNLAPNTSINSQNTTTGAGAGLQLSNDGSYTLAGNDNAGNSSAFFYQSSGGFTQMTNAWSGGTVNDIRLQNHLGGGLLFNLHEGWTVNSYFNNLGGFNGFDFNSPTRILFTGNFSGFTGLQYGSDYSSKYVDRSLIDFGFLKSFTSASGITSASNGLNKIGSGVELGGFLTNTTTIYTSGQTFNIIGYNANDINILNTGSTIITARGGFIIGHDLLSNNISYDNLGNLQTSSTGTTSIFSTKNIVVDSTSGGVKILGSTGITLQTSVINLGTTASEATNVNINANNIQFKTATNGNSFILDGQWDVFLGGFNNPVQTLDAAVGTTDYQNISGFKFRQNYGFLRAFQAGNTIGAVGAKQSGVGVNAGISTKRGAFIAGGGTPVWYTELLLGGDTSGSTIFTDNRTGSHRSGIEYAGNYSTGFTKYSIVDKNFVTGLTSSSGIQTANNGLTKTGTNVHLGGALTGNTIISGNTFDLNISSKGFRVNEHGDGVYLIDNNGGGVFLEENGGGIFLQGTNGGIFIQESAGGGIGIGRSIWNNGGINITDRNSIDISARDASGNIKFEFNLNPNGSAIFSDFHTGATAHGLKYNADYSAGFTARSLIDAAYVTGKTAIANNNFVFGTGTGIGAHASQFTANENVLVVMTQTPPIFSGSSANINNVFVFGEAMELRGAPTGGGTITDSGMFGFGHRIGDGVTFFSGSGSFTYGEFNDNYSGFGIAGGAGSRLLNVGSGGVAISLDGNPTIGGSTRDNPSYQWVIASGNAVNISKNSTGQTAGHGALAPLSVILGGQDHNVPSASTRSVIIGGNRINVATGVTDTVHLPKLRIGLGIGGKLTTGSTSQNFLVVDGITGEVQIATNTSSGVATKYSTTISGNSVTTSFTVTHNKNTRDIIVQVYDNQSFDTVIVDVVRNGVNTVQVNFVSAPATGTNYRVVVI